MPPKVAAVPYGKLLYIHRLFSCFVAFLFCIEEKLFLKGLCGHKKKDFSSLFNFFNYFDTQKKQTGYGYIWFCKIVFGANGSMNEGSNKGKSNICSL